MLRSCQHTTRPTRGTAHENSSPADTVTASVTPATSCGRPTLGPLPWPSWNVLFAPQQATAPLEVTAHVCMLAETATTSDRSTTLTGARSLPPTGLPLP